MRMHQNIYIKLKKDYAEKTGKKNGIEIQSHHLGGNRQLSMEGISVEYLTSSIEPVSNEKI